MSFYELLTTGLTHTLTQNQVYALPSKNVWVQSSAVIQASLDGSTFVDVTATTTGVHVVAPFVRSSTTGTIFMAKILS